MSKSITLFISIILAIGISFGQDDIRHGISIK